MNWIGILLLVSVIWLIWRVKKGKWSGRKTRHKTEHPIYQRDFFSTNEMRLYTCLREIVDEITHTDVALLSKVRWEDIWRAKKGDTEWQYRGFLRSRHIDFVILNVEENRPAILIELNDKSHLSQKVQERDNRLKEFCASTNTPILFIQTKSNYDKEEIKKEIKECLERG